MGLRSRLSLSSSLSHIPIALHDPRDLEEQREGGIGKVRYKDLELQILYNEKEIDSWICNSLSCAVLSPAGLLISFNGESPYQTCDSPIKEDRETSVRECI